jgi:pantoate--beta-alanine ligase
MGALHNGHMSLLERSVAENQLTACSIFINPAQFNDKKDLLLYPRTPGSDLKMLGNTRCDVVFLPPTGEMYPDDSMLEMDFGPLERVMEGEFRTGHFKGVATVVSRLFDLFQPSSAYFGEKDFQQLVVIREMNRRLNTGIRIVGCPTIREPDGLAMSSRNIRLTEKERKEAPVIYHALLMAAEMVRHTSTSQIREYIVKMIEASGSFKVQYLEFVDSSSLQAIDSFDPAGEQRACIAVTASFVRLIDNVSLQEPHH